MKAYYENGFPFDDLVKWLGPDLPNREFSFTLGETYLRYRSFQSAAELKQAVVKLVPDKIDIGAIYNCPPKTKHDRFYPMGRELVFDLDATDCIRTCPCADTICVRCWPLMMVSVKIIHKCLTEDLGFEHILWVYSGRRGVHCWVSDERARYLTNEARTQVVDFILRQCFKQDYMNILRPFFRQRLNAEKLFDGTSLAEEFKCSYDTWSHDLKSNQLEALVVKAVGPKLDVKVTVRMDHLLKCPYSPHPKTKQLCVPIPNIDTFDPFSVPTVTQPPLFCNLLPPPASFAKKPLPPQIEIVSKK